MMKIFSIIKRIFGNNKIHKKRIIPRPISNLTLKEYLAQNISDYSEEFGDICIIEPYTLEKCKMRYKDGYITDEDKKTWKIFFDHFENYYVTKSEVKSSIEYPNKVDYIITIIKDPRSAWKMSEIVV